MKNKTLIIVAIVIALFGAMAWKLASNKKEINSRKQIRTVDNRIAVTVASAEPREMNTQLNLTGLTEPYKEVTVASESTGKIIQINFKLGDFVRKGTLLASVDDTYKRLAFENAQLNYNKYSEDYKRYQLLRKGDAVSDDQLRDMKIGFENAAIQLKNAKKQLDDTKIMAPFSGFITSKDTELGAYVNTGTPIAGIADISRLKIAMEVSESNVYQLHKGQDVNVTANVYPGVSYKGSISGIGSQGSSAHTFPVELVIANTSKNPLKAGTYVNTRIDLGNTGKALMIPRDAIVSSAKAPSVYVVRGDSVELVRINTGHEYDAYLEVSSGIKAGDQVVTTGQINLSDGAKISIEK